MKEERRKNKKYSPKFKVRVIMDMRENGLSQRETVRKYWGTKSKAEEDCYRSQVRAWERKYMEEGEAGLMEERRGRKSKGRPRKRPLDKEIEGDLIAENQRLRERLEYLEAENEYLKKLGALVRAEEQKSGKGHK